MITSRLNGWNVQHNNQAVDSRLNGWNRLGLVQQGNGGNGGGGNPPAVNAPPFGTPDLSTYTNNIGQYNMWASGFAGNTPAPHFSDNNTWNNSYNRSGTTQLAQMYTDVVSFTGNATAIGDNGGTVTPPAVESTVIWVADTHFNRSSPKELTEFRGSFNFNTTTNYTLQDFLAMWQADGIPYLSTILPTRDYFRIKPIMKDSAGGTVNNIPTGGVANLFSLSGVFDDTVPYVYCDTLGFTGAGLSILSLPDNMLGYSQGSVVGSETVTYLWEERMGDELNPAATDQGLLSSVSNVRIEAIAPDGSKADISTGGNSLPASVTISDLETTLGVNLSTVTTGESYFIVITADSDLNVNPLPLCHITEIRITA